MKTLILAILLAITPTAFALNLDCDGTILKNLQSDVDVTEVIQHNGILTNYYVEWDASYVGIIFDQMNTFISSTVVWGINRKDFSYTKATIELGKAEALRETGTCKIWKKPANNAF